VHVCYDSLLLLWDHPVSAPHWRAWLPSRAPGFLLQFGFNHLWDFLAPGLLSWLNLRKQAPPPNWTGSSFCRVGFHGTFPISFLALELLGCGHGTQHCRHLRTFPPHTFTSGNQCHNDREEPTSCWQLRTLWQVLRHLYSRIEHWLCHYSNLDWLPNRLWWLHPCLQLHFLHHFGCRNHIWPLLWKQKQA